MKYYAIGWNSNGNCAREYSLTFWTFRYSILSSIPKSVRLGDYCNRKRVSRSLAATGRKRKCIVRDRTNSKNAQLWAYMPNIISTYCWCSDRTRKRQEKRSVVCLCFLLYCLLYGELLPNGSSKFCKLLLPCTMWNLYENFDGTSFGRNIQDLLC